MTTMLATIGSQWTTEIVRLKNAGSTFEAAYCFHRLNDLLGHISYSDRTKFCKVDVDSCIKQLSVKTDLWTKDLRSLSLELYAKHFDMNSFSKLSMDLILEILLWLPVDDFPPVLCVSKEWNQLGTTDKVWKFFYHHRFLRHNPLSFSEVVGSYMRAFKSRLDDPHVGDKVEVAWRGKFRLEATDVYQGLAWWVAEVVDKHSAANKYKIKYPGWDDRWDEWVPRSRLRWAVDKNTIVQISPNDTVEIWCCGATVPGAWLESRVTEVRDGSFCVGNVLTSGLLWVPRDRLRLVKHERVFDENPSDTLPALDTSTSLPMDFSSISLFGRSISLRRLSRSREGHSAPRSPQTPRTDNSDHNQSLSNLSSPDRNSCTLM